MSDLLTGTGVACPSCGVETDGQKCGACGHDFYPALDLTSPSPVAGAVLPPKAQLDHYSFSCLSKLDRCPRWWKASYFEGVADPTSPEARRGTWVHEAVEKYTVHCIQHRLDTDMRYAHKLARECPDPYAAQIIEGLGDFLCLDPATVIADGAGVEREFSLETAAGDTVQGRFDRLEWNAAEAELIVTDYKSGRVWTMPPAPTQQLRLYGWAAKKLWPQAQIVTLQVMYLGSRRTGAWTLGADDPLIGEEWLQAWIDRAKALTLAPEQPGSWCAYCGRVEDCAKGRLAREIAIVDEGDAVDMAGSCLVYEAAATRLRKQLDTWRRENTGTVRTGDQERADALPEWFIKGEVHAELKPDADLWAFLEAARESGLDLSKLVKVDARLAGLAFDAPDPDNEGVSLFDSPTRAAGLGELQQFLQPITPPARATWRKIKEADEDADSVEGADE